MLRVPIFVKNYNIGCVNSPKFANNYTAGCAILIHKGLHSKITETVCVSILALKINYNLGSAFLLFSARILSAARFYLM